MLWAAALVMTGAWLLYGLALIALARSIHPVLLTDWPLVIGALAASFVVSLVVLFVPAGLGVRESAIAALLGTVLPPGLAVVVAIVSRIVLMLSELAGFGAIWFVGLALRTRDKRRI